MIVKSKVYYKRALIPWQTDESYSLLGNGQGSETIEGLTLALDMLKFDEGIKSHPLALKTNSLAKMYKLKLLQLKYVELTGSFKKLPELRWLCWHRCHLKKIPSGLLMSSMVALDMSYGSLKTFEPPMVLNSLKILNLKECSKLVTIRHLSRLPNLETLILWNCRSLTHVCKTIACLESLAVLDFTGCWNLLKCLSDNKNVNQLQRLKGLCTGGGIPQESFFSLPDSLKFLFLNNCISYIATDVPLVFSGRQLFYMNLGNNQFQHLPNNINLNMLRVLELTFCSYLTCLLCLPSTLEELYILYGCCSLEKITFESARFRLREFVYQGCKKVSEVQGLFKLVSIAQLDGADLGHMKWIKAYQDLEVTLVGDEIAKDRVWPIQVLYEYGIMSIYLPGIKDPSMTTSEYTSSSPFLSFRVPSCPKKRRIQRARIMIRGFCSPKLVIQPKALHGCTTLWSIASLAWVKMLYG